MDGIELLRAIGNKYNPRILQQTHQPKSAQELSEELDIPMATSYRRIEELQELGLLEKEGKEFADEGRQRTVYRRQIDGVTITFGERNEEVQVEMKQRTAAKNKLADVWSDLKQSNP